MKEKKSDKVKNVKPVWRAFIPLMIEIPLAVAIVWGYGYYEVMKFYNDPNHIGFAIPAGAFLLAAAAFVITFVLLIICIIVAVRRAKRNKLYAE